MKTPSPVAHWLLVHWLVLVGCTGLATATVSRAESARERIAVESVVLDGPAAVAGVRVRSVLELRSEVRSFGGFSGMAVSEGGSRLTAISDRGFWLMAMLDHGPEGRLRGLYGASMGPLLEPDGRPVNGRARRDAEELVRLSDGDWLISFEGDHRLWRVPLDAEAGVVAPAGRPRPVDIPLDFEQAHGNLGMEAMTHLLDGRVLVITEGRRVAEGQLLAWLGDPEQGSWETLTVATSGLFLPTGASLLPGGDVLLVERAFDPRTGTRIRLSRIAQDTIVAGAVLSGDELARFGPEQPVDNVEAIAARSGSAGETLIYMLSDDNFSDQQRTLLFQLELPAAAVPAAP